MRYVPEGGRPWIADGAAVTELDKPILRTARAVSVFRIITIEEG